MSSSLKGALAWNRGDQLTGIFAVFVRDEILPTYVYIYIYGPYIGITTIHCKKSSWTHQKKDNVNQGLVFDRCSFVPGFWRILIFTWKQQNTSRIHKNDLLHIITIYHKTIPCYYLPTNHNIYLLIYYTNQPIHEKTANLIITSHGSIAPA